MAMTKARVLAYLDLVDCRTPLEEALNAAIAEQAVRRTKPAGWVDQAEIDDPEDKKPADWGDHHLVPAKITHARIPDPNATAPEEWDAEKDGEWEPPLIDNPDATKPEDWDDGEGEWEPPLVDNPAYRPARIPDPDATAPEEWDEKENGEWIAPLVDNPAFQGTSLRSSHPSTRPPIQPSTASALR